MPQETTSYSGANMVSGRRMLGALGIGACLLVSACATPPDSGGSDSASRAGIARGESALQSPLLQRAALAQADLSDEELDDVYDYDEGDYDEDALFGVSGSENEGDGDPLETLNRFTFAFNDMLDTLFLRPVAFTYRELVPSGIRDALRNFLRNLSTPVILANDLLQGDGDRALNTSKRFFVNTAFSLGFYDYAGELGLPYQDADFGQTLGTYGAGEGFYIVLPVFGPSSLRDATGRIVDRAFDPLTYLSITHGDDAQNLTLPRSIVSGVDARARSLDMLDQALADSLDDYTRIRSLWRQAREDQIQKRAPRDAELEFGTSPFPDL
ncbi:MlaA family lipoprotein [Aquibaculum sediminis]|uniref:MlaA family lipoprotein n=1 Tax=Aquibaculum sediminis TaxID=3231907 RepID=UPI00345662EB